MAMFQFANCWFTRGYPHFWLHTHYIPIPIGYLQFHRIFSSFPAPAYHIPGKSHTPIFITMCIYTYTHKYITFVYVCIYIYYIIIYILYNYISIYFFIYLCIYVFMGHITGDVPINLADMFLGYYPRISGTSKR
jgi:hypothetical protein